MIYCAEYQRSQGTMEAICRNQCDSCKKVDLKNNTMNDNELELLDTEIWKGGVQQITIDFVENANFDFSEINEFEKETLGARLYQLSIVLEIIDPFFKKDVEVLNKLNVCLEKLLVKKTLIDISNNKN